MLILPAIDLFEKKAVRLYKGDYNQITVYSDNPLEVAQKFESCGASWIHVVDLEGAKNGDTPNIDVVKKIVEGTNLNVEIGGGIRSISTIDKYLSIGVKRVILGTIAVKDENLLKTAIAKYGYKIAVGIDIKDGFVAIKGWTESTNYSCFEFCEKMEKLGVKTIICTDISKDGAMQGTNRELYRELSTKFNLDIVASGGVSSLEDVVELSKLNIYGAIIGKAYYVGAIDLVNAIEVSKC